MTNRVGAEPTGLAEARDQSARGDLAQAAAGFENALSLGLEGEERYAALFGLGSALLALGRTDEAHRILVTARSEFPERAALRALYAVTLHDQVGEGRAPPTGPIDAFADLARALGEKEFERLFDFPFLLPIAPALASSYDDTNEETQFTAGLNASPPLAQATEILFVRPSRGRGGNEVVVGRASASDIALSDGRISKVHARFSRTDEGWRLADAGSRNGTFAGNRRAAPDGTPLPIESGETVSFGHVAFFFLSAAALWNHLRR